MRAFFSLYFTNLFLVAGIGLLTTYLALYLGDKGIDTFWVGALTSCYYLGLLTGAKIGVHFIRSVGHIRTFAASTAVVIACVATHGIDDNLWLWLSLRFIVGLGMMCNYMVLESWLNEQTSAEQRGKVFSFYMITSYVGMITGQFALSLFPELGYAPLFLVCAALAIGIVPIATTRRIHPRPLKPLSYSVLSYFRQAPQSLTAVMFAGIISGSFYGLAPTFASQAGLAADEIALFMVTTILAGLLAQWPMGLLSDRVRRSILLRSNAVVIGLISLAILILPTTPNYLFPLTFVFGFCAFTLYPLASALANSRVTDEHRVGMSSALLVAFAGGAGVGSVAIAQVMTAFGHHAFYAALCVLTVVMFSLLSFINARQKKEQPQASDYVVSSSDVTISPVAASMDPRFEEEQVEEQLLEKE